MLGWEIVLFFVALFYAGKIAFGRLADGMSRRSAQKQERRAHKSQLVSQALAEGQAPAAAKAAAKLGANAAVSVTSWGAMWIAFKASWMAGWRVGKRRGAELRDRRSSSDEPVERTDSEEGTERFDDPVDEEIPPECTHSAAVVIEYSNLIRSHDCVYDVGGRYLTCGHYVPRFCGQPIGDSEDQQCRDHAPDREEPEQLKEQIVAIETRTGGEVLTKEQYRAEIEAVIKEAEAELEDAQEDIKRAQQDVGRVETMAASLASAEIDRSTVEATRELVDTNADRTRLAKDRIAAAELRKAKAERCLDTLNSSAQNAFFAS